ncbi:MAG: YicC family protein [Nitrospirae bacterium RBG_13_39_12]|nr:MAG: YicC family protein [Nitrospirae bacterium RBG_13_39_12]
MIQSMTGFGSAENNEFRVEIRSLNHRFIDIAIKMPPYMNQYEIPLRNSIKERFKRGRFDVFISATNNNQVQIKINKELARNIYSNLKDLQKEFTIPGKINMETLLGYREILIEEEPQYDIDALYASFNEAISNLESMRMREGALLSEELLKRIRLLDKMNNEIKLLVPNEIAKWREKFTERLKSVLDTEGTDANRIIQEAAILADKFDISEEVSRVESHIKQFIEILDNGNIIGKKLDFLLQEINREVNTLSYKSSDYAVSSLVIEMKTEIEKIREQVQNIQ